VTKGVGVKDVHDNVKPIYRVYSGLPAICAHESAIYLRDIWRHKVLYEKVVVAAVETKAGKGRGEWTLSG
jgi:hypothetical protein